LEARRWHLEPGAVPATALKGGLLAWLQSLFVLGMAGTFLVALHTYVLVDPLYRQATTWYQTVNICLIGMVAAIGSFPPRLALRAVPAGGVLLMLAGCTA